MIKKQEASKNEQRKKKRNKIITTIGWASVITSIPWVVGASVIITKFRDQRQVVNQLKPEKEQLKAKNKQSDLKIKTLELKKQISITHITQLEDRITNLDEEIKKVEILKNDIMKEITKQKTIYDKLVGNNISLESENNDYKEKIKKLEIDLESLELHKIEISENVQSAKDKLKQWRKRNTRAITLLRWVEKINPKLLEDLHKIYAAKVILDKLKTVTTIKNSRTSSSVYYNNLQTFIDQNALKFSTEDRKILDDIPILVVVEPVHNMQKIKFNLHQNKYEIVISEVIVTGFK